MPLYVNGIHTGKQKRSHKEESVLNIKVNGQPRELDGDEIAVSELLALEQVKNPETVAVQVNGGFLKKEQYSAVILKNGDEVEFLYFMGGGQVRTQ